MTRERLTGYLLDAGLAAVVFAITLSVPTEGTRVFDALGLALAALVALPLVARRREPLAVLLLVGGASGALVWLGYVDGSAPGVLVALYTLAVDRDQTLGGATGAVVAGLFLLHMVAMREAMVAGYPGAPAFALLWAGAWLVGGGVRHRRGSAELERRACSTRPSSPR